MNAEAELDRQRSVLAAAAARTELRLEQLWVRYLGLGGLAGLVELDAYLHDLMPLDPAQADILAYTVNERLDELVDRARVPYNVQSAAPALVASAHASLAQLLEGTHLASADDLPAAVRRAGFGLGVHLSIYLVSYDQRHLHLVPDSRADLPTTLAVEGTLAGRAFQLLEDVAVRHLDQPHLWLPLLDGVERLGVLRVALARPDDDTPTLRQHLRWVSLLTGHLISAVNTHGDALDAVRRQDQPRTVAGELIWQLLPPLTFGVENFVVTGLLEPCNDVGGDVFDYALNGNIAHIAIFDATGHTLLAGAAAAVALAAYRSARRNGASLYETVRVVDDAVAAQIHAEDQRYVSAVFAELDITTGRLRYVGAGHPYPLLVRQGKAVKRLEQGRRPLLGLRRSELTIGEEFLEPGDWLVLYTDGITEARDADGAFFGVDRLADFIQREASAEQPPPETLRRLIRAVLKHQHEVLQDDATIVIAGWRSGLGATLDPG